MLLHRSQSKVREEPFNFIQIEGETVVFQTIRAEKISRSSCVKPITRPNEDFLETTDIREIYNLDNETQTNLENKNAKAFTSTQDMVLIGKRGTKPRDDIINNVKKFKQSGMEELTVLWKLIPSKWLILTILSRLDAYFGQDLLALSRPSILV